MTVRGACLFTKRLERGRFLWPSVADGVVTISPAQLGYLLSGIDWRNPPGNLAADIGGLTVFASRFSADVISILA